MIYYSFELKTEYNAKNCCKWVSDNKTDDIVSFFTLSNHFVPCRSPFVQYSQQAHFNSNYIHIWDIYYLISVIVYEYLPY